MYSVMKVYYKAGFLRHGQYEKFYLLYPLLVPLVMYPTKNIFIIWAGRQLVAKVLETLICY